MVKCCYFFFLQEKCFTKIRRLPGEEARLASGWFSFPFPHQGKGTNGNREERKADRSSGGGVCGLAELFSSASLVTSGGGVQTVRRMFRPACLAFLL